MLIMVSNDDGYNADGIKALTRSLKKLGRVVVVAPEWEQSGTGHSLTLYRPLRSKKISKDIYAVNGTPTDAIMVGMNCLLKRKPDILISGINNGANMGDDVTYSGTVAAAIEGTILGIPSIAVSQIFDKPPIESNIRAYDKAARFAARVAKSVLKYGIPKGTLLNINVPDPVKADSRRHRVTRLGERVYHDVITEKIDPRGEPYFWIGGHYTVTGDDLDTDYSAIRDGYISVTPLDIDMTNRSFINDISKWKI